MGLIPDSQVGRLRDHLRDRLIDPVTITLELAPPALIDDGTADQRLGDEAAVLVDEVCGLSELLSVDSHDRAVADATCPFPRIVVPASGGGTIRYVGLPAGNEFPNFIQLLESVSRQQSGLTQSSRTELAKLSEPVHLRVFVTPT